LCVLAGAGGAERFAGDVARLLGLAKGMRAAALEHDAAQLARARGAPQPAARAVRVPHRIAARRNS
jgi:hypothetical protein